MNDVHSPSLDSVEADAPADEIEITPEMIEAGEEVLLGELGGGVSCHWDPRDLAISVYLAMAVQLSSKRDPKLLRNQKAP